MAEEKRGLRSQKHGRVVIYWQQTVLGRLDSRQRRQVVGCVARGDGPRGNVLRSAWANQNEVVVILGPALLARLAPVEEGSSEDEDEDDDAEDDAELLTAGQTIPSAGAESLAFWRWRARDSWILCLSRFKKALADAFHLGGD